MPAATRALVQRFGRRMQIDDRAVLLHQLAVRGANDDAAARSEDDVGARGELRECGLLAVAEARFAFDFEYRRDGDAQFALELGVGIDERFAEAPRQLAAERRLAGAG